MQSWGPYVIKAKWCVGRVSYSFPINLHSHFPSCHESSIYPHYFVLCVGCEPQAPTSGIVYSAIQERRSLSCRDHLGILIRGKIKNSHGFWKYSASVWKAPWSSREEIFQKWRKRHQREADTLILEWKIFLLCPWSFLVSSHFLYGSYICLLPSSWISTPLTLFLPFFFF